MAKKIVKAQMMQRRDTALQWSIKNPVLLDGELGIVKDQPGSYKVGDGVTAWNDLPLRGFDGNIVHTPGESTTAVMSQKGVTEVTDLLGKRIAESATEVTRLSQEWQEIKDAHFNIIVNPHIDIVDMGAATAATIEPDKYYIFGEVATLAVGFVAAAEGKVGNYAFQFTSPASSATTLSLPIGVKFPVESDSELIIKPATIYQISVLNGLAVATSWEV